MSDTTPSNTIDPTTMHWPSERFFWAVLEVAHAKAGPLTAPHYELLADDVPVPVNGLHAVGVPMGDSRLLVCATRLSDLEAIPPTTLSLTPWTLPAWLNAGDPSTHANHIEFLAGAFEPRPLRRQRTLRHGLIAAAVLLTGLMLCVGLRRRTAQWVQVAEAARTTSSGILTKVSHTQSPQVLQRELEDQRKAAAASRPLSPRDAAQALASLLAVWPKGVDAEASSVSISAQAVTLALSVPGDARPLLAALKPPAGWILEEPRLGTSGNLTRVSLSLRRGESHP